MPDGSVSGAVSTRETAKTRAETFCQEYIQAGLHLDRYNRDNGFAHGVPTLADYINQTNFMQRWADDKAVQAKKAITSQWVSERETMINTHILPFFGDVLISDIKTRIIKDFRNTLVLHRKLSGSRVNHIQSVLLSVLKYAVEDELIDSLPLVERISQRPEQKKDRLSTAEVIRVFSAEWDNFKSYVANYLACLTGIRAGELMALKRTDIDIINSEIMINKSYNHKMKGFKSTKTGESRVVGIPEVLKPFLVRLMNIHGSDLVFVSDRTDGTPVNHHFLQRYFYRVMDGLGIDYKQRNITFHSHRYYFNSVILESNTPEAIVRKATGHSSHEMTDHYLRTEEKQVILDVINSLHGAKNGSGVLQ